MSTLPMRLLTGLVATAVYPFIALAGFSAYHVSSFWSTYAMFTMFLFIGAPAFMLAGPACSIFIDRFLHRTAVRGGLAAYALNAVLHSLAGASIAALYAALWSGATLSERPDQLFFFGASAGLLYYHVGLAVQAVVWRLYLSPFRRPIETERLRLIPCSLTVYKQAQTRGYPIPEHVKMYIEHLRQYPLLLGWGVWLVELKGTGELIGDAGFKGNPDHTRTVDIGYGFLPHVRGRGYATEAAQALVRWAFAHGAVRVTAETLRNNAASIRVLRKSGFQLYREEEHFYWQIQMVEGVHRI